MGFHLSAGCQVEGVSHPRHEEDQQSSRLHHRKQNQDLRRRCKHGCGLALVRYPLKRGSSFVRYPVVEGGSSFVQRHDACDEKGAFLFF